MFQREQRANFDYIAGDELDQLKATLQDTQCFQSGQMQQLKGIMRSLQSVVREKTQSEVTAVKVEVAEMKRRLCNMTEFSGLSAEQQQQLTQAFDAFDSQISQQTLIAVIRDNLQRFKSTTYPQQLSKMTAWAQPVPQIAGKTADDKLDKPMEKEAYENTSSSGSAIKASDQIIHFVSCRDVIVDFDKAWLADEADVENYLVAMKKALLAEVQTGKRIQI